MAVKVTPLLMIDLGEYPDEIMKDPKVDWPALLREAGIKINDKSEIMAVMFSDPETGAIKDKLVMGDFIKGQ